MNPYRLLPKLVIAAIIAPEVVKYTKPIVKAVGKGLEKTGEFIQKLADDVEDPKPKPHVQEVVAEAAPAEAVVEEPAEPTEPVVEAEIVEAETKAED